MLISIFTISHNPKRLPDLYESIKRQKHRNRERIILLNNGANRSCDDPRVKIYHSKHLGNYIGRLKYEACEKCNGEWLVEVDHDDLLTPDCLEEIAKVPDEYCFAYGNTVAINRPQITPKIYDKYFGWTGRPFKFMGKDVVEMICAEPHPQSISRVRFAPDHPRAWRRDDYFKIGGHNPEMKILDDQDLIERTYLYGEMYHINKPLYIYRIRGDNTRQQNENEIQIKTRDIHNKYFEKMMMKWSGKNGLKILDLGGALNKPEGYTSVDRHNADLIFDLNENWDLPDNSVGLLRTHHILEHLSNSIHVMNEAWRVLTHGGIMEIEVPSDCGVFRNGIYYPPYGASCDPTHVSRWNKRSFKYYTSPQMRKYIEPEAKCKFVQLKSAEEVLVFDNIPVVRVTLMAEKGGERFYGPNNRV